MHAGLSRLNRIMLVINRRRWTCQVVYFINFQIKRKCHIVSNQLKIRIVREFRYVSFRSGVKVVDTNDIVPLRQQAPAKMRTKKTGAPLLRVFAYQHALFYPTLSRDWTSDFNCLISCFSVSYSSIFLRKKSTVIAAFS